MGTEDEPSEIAAPRETVGDDVSRTRANDDEERETGRMPVLLFGRSARANVSRKFSIFMEGILAERRVQKKAHGGFDTILGEGRKTTTTQRRKGKSGEK